jgi:hypothetical protein
MQSQDIEEIKAALWEQAFLGCTQVRYPIGQVMAIRRRKGQLLVLIMVQNCNIVHRPVKLYIPKFSGMSHTIPKVRVSTEQS